MLSWEDFAVVEPNLAKIGENLLFQFGVGLAFLATIRKDGAPRIHPVCPVMSNGRLYVLIMPTSPKKDDLLRDGRFALQTFPPPREESEEFYVSGCAAPIADDEVRRAVLSDARHTAREDEALFELWVDRVMHTTWVNWGTPDLRPVHRIWHGPS
ncbi:MAG TPA: pyridoxamine 5'-phosphate oxidase [Chloroflexi bacterium]|nr:pyridoxamine 5'-phosphate oxidase [Chloroflexota bacterium]